MRDDAEHASFDDEPAHGADGMRVAIVVSSYHEAITGSMCEAAAETFLALGGRRADLLVVPAPGAWELIPIAAALLDRPDLDAVVCLGCILTGETTHDRHLAEGLSHAMGSLAAHHARPVSFGILTCATRAQALARAGGAVGNKGEEAMLAALESIAAIRAIEELEPDQPFPDDWYDEDADADDDRSGRAPGDEGAIA